MIQFQKIEIKEKPKKAVRAINETFWLLLDPSFWKWTVLTVQFFKFNKKKEHWAQKALSFSALSTRVFFSFKLFSEQEMKIFRFPYFPYLWLSLDLRFTEIVASLVGEQKMFPWCNETKSWPSLCRMARRPDVSFEYSINCVFQDTHCMTVWAKIWLHKCCFNRATQAGNMNSFWGRTA